MAKFSIVLVALLATLVSFSVSAKIQEIKSMKEIQSSLDADTLLVFDIDNTLLESTTVVGSDQWYDYLYVKAGKKPLEDPALDHRIMQFWNDTQSKIQVKAVEAITPDLIRSAQKSGMKTMALTARTLDIAEVTLKQLNSIGVEFSGHTVFTRDFRIGKKELGTVDDALFTRGVLSIGESNVKGEALAYFLKAIHLTPKKIVFVDDKLRNVRTVEAAMGKANIPYFGFRYGALDEKVRVYRASMQEAVPAH